MLTKEECNQAQGILCNFVDYHEECFDADKLSMSLSIFAELIYEHFELLEKYQNLQDENARLSFDKIVNNIEGKQVDK